jgi:hypothetical protein
LSFQTRYSGSELNTFLGISKKSLHPSRSLTNLIWREKIQEHQNGRVVGGKKGEKTKAKAFMKVAYDLCGKTKTLACLFIEGK